MFCHITANWRGRPLTSYQVVLETIAATTTAAGLEIGAELDTGDYPLGTTVTTAEFQALPVTPEAFHGDWNYTLAPDPPSPSEEPAPRRPIDPAVTRMLTDPTLTGIARSEFAHLVAVSEPYWDALAEAAFQRRFHRPRGYLHPKTSSLDHFHRLLAALLRRRRATTSTLLAQLLGVTRTNLSNQFQDDHRILDLHRIAVTPIPGSPARTLEQLQARLVSANSHPTDQLCQLFTDEPPGGPRTARSVCSPPTPPAGGGLWWTGSCICPGRGRTMRTAAGPPASRPTAASPPRENSPAGPGCEPVRPWSQRPAPPALWRVGTVLRRW
ncbi:hypothetical protein FHS40_009279, partial [Streptomyces spectabilis]|nr:hypothetical protein [Streptomyces spectabilis]